MLACVNGSGVAGFSPKTGRAGGDRAANIRATAVGGQPQQGADALRMMDHLRALQPSLTSKRNPVNLRARLSPAAADCFFFSLPSLGGD